MSKKSTTAAAASVAAAAKKNEKSNVAKSSKKTAKTYNLNGTIYNNFADFAAARRVAMYDKKHAAALAILTNEKQAHNHAAAAGRLAIMDTTKETFIKTTLPLLEAAAARLEQGAAAAILIMSAAINEVPADIISRCTYTGKLDIAPLCRWAASDSYESLKATRKAARNARNAEKRKAKAAAKKAAKK